jgi:phenylalanyl-tRNA synthetase beta chain
MWLSLNILSKMVDTAGIPLDELTHRLTMSTAEIDSVENVNEHFKTIYTAKILDVKEHPNADSLTLVDLETGGRKCRVVCGAPNHKKGDIVPLATIGTKFSSDMVIKKAKIRGEESEGMLCSERELGLSDDHSGIMILPPDTKVGVSFADLFPHWVDVRFEIDNKSITHRPDLWSHEGFAREIGALFKRPFKSIVDAGLLDTLEDTQPLAVTILNPEAAPRYSGLVVTGIKIEESPDWLKANVQAIGMRPINNIVDITNYVMAELGEPMHAFDRKKLNGTEILVRLARRNEPLITLDGQTFELFNEDIVIADSKGPIALAGVMGGGNSEIENDTTEIVLEAANFNPVNIRKTANRYAHRTEAAIRFEKSLSPEVTVPALIRCYDLIRQIIPGARAASKIIDAYPAKQKRIAIHTSTDFIRKRLGENIDDAGIMEILTALDFTVRASGKDLSVEVPHYRATKDISIPEDIVEEVGRIYGYDNIHPRAPMVSCASPARNQFRQFERKIKDILSSNHNMIEVSGYSFVGEEILNKLKINADKELRLSNPLSIEQDRLRTSLLPNLISNLRLNNRYWDDFCIYEFGRVYLKNKRTSAELAEEKTMSTGAVYRKKPGAPLYYEAKGIVKGLMEKLQVRDYVINPIGENPLPYMHPVRTAELKVENGIAGLIFELHPDTLKECDINGDVAMFDIDVNALFKAKKRDRGFTELQKFPEVPFEVSVIADRNVYARDICSILEKSGIELIQGVDVVAVYEGNPIPEGKKSVSLKVIFASRDRTLSSEEIDALQKKVILLLKKNGYELR